MDYKRKSSTTYVGASRSGQYHQSHLEAYTNVQPLRMLSGHIKFQLFN